MSSILVDLRSNLVISAGLTYDFSVPGLIGCYDGGELKTTISGDHANFEEVAVDSVPSSVILGITKYVDGEFVGLESSTGIEVAAAMLARWPQMTKMTTAEKVAFANEVAMSRKMGITDFLVLCMASGAAPSDFKEIWNYPQYKLEVNEAINLGELQQIQAFLYTMPWTVSQATADAIQAVLAQIALTRSAFMCIELGYEPSSLTTADFV